MPTLELRSGALVVPPITLTEVLLDYRIPARRLRCPSCGRLMEPVATDSAYGLCVRCLKEVPLEDD